MPVLIQFFFAVAILILVPFIGLIKTLLAGFVFVAIYMFFALRK